jgi:transposase
MAKPLIDGTLANYLLAHRGYDSNEIIGFSADNGSVPVIPPKKNRKEQQACDKDLYKRRHLVEILS